MKKAKIWVPPGILDLVVGVPTLAFGILLAGNIEPWVWWTARFYRSGAVSGAMLITFATIAIIGGVFALRKKVWGLALTGSICALFATFFLTFLFWPAPGYIYLLISVPAIMLTVLGEKAVKGTWLPLAAGILDLAVGVPALLFGIFFAAGIDPFLWWPSLYEPSALTGGVLITFATIAITGGVFALRKNLWGLALAGSICALFANLFLIPFLSLWPAPAEVFLLVSVPAVVFTVLGRRSFE
jgi:hypothetical protein